MTIEVSGKQLAALVRGEAIMIGPSKRVITLDDGPFVVQRGGAGSGHHGHRGRQGEVGGSLPSDDTTLQPEKPPSLPRELRSGSSGDVQDRNRLRKKIMEEKYPGIRFSIAGSNPLGVKKAKELGIPGVGIPRAIWDGDVESRPNLTSIVQAALDEFGAPIGGFLTYTSIKYATELTFEEVFGAIKAAWEVDPKSVSMTVDRTNANTAVRFVGPIVERGGPGSGFHGHVGREGEVGGSAPEGTPGFQRPGMSAYGSGVFTPLLKDVIYGWQDQDGWGTAQSIYQNIVRAKEQGDEDYEGLAISEDGILQGIGALDYSASNDEFEKLAAEDLPEFDINEYLKIDGLYTPDPAFSEELIIQMAAEAAKHGKGLWMKTTDKSGPFAAQMGMSIVGEAYAYWTPEQVAQVAETATGTEPIDYYAPPTKPRITMSFGDAYEESIPSNPTSGQPAPKSVSEMSPEERYRWENFNYSNWATPERWNPEQMAREQLGVDEEEKLSNIYDLQVVEDLQKIHDGWIDGTDSPWSVRFSEAVAGVFGGDPIPASRTRGEHETPTEWMEELSYVFGEEVVTGEDDRANWNTLTEDEQWEMLDEFNAFASGAREEDIATDLTTVVQSMYDTTQAKLKEAGYSPGDTVRLYRGLQSNPEERLDGHDGGWVNVQQWAFSSWTAAKMVAGDFATMEGEYSTEDGMGTLLTADIPVERILANWQTGPGSHGEFEYLVLGEGGIDSYATKTESSRRYASVKEGKQIEAGTPASGEYAVGPEIE